MSIGTTTVFAAGEVSQGELTRVLREAGRTLRLTVPLGCRRTFELPPLPAGSTLHIEWDAPGNGVRGATVTLGGAAEAPGRFGFVRVEIASQASGHGVEAEIRADGPGNVAKLRSFGAVVVVDRRFCGRLREIDIGGSLAGAVIGRTRVQVGTGSCHAFQREDALHLEEATNAQFHGEADDVRLVVRHARRARFERVLLSVEQNGSLEQCSGVIRLITAECARVMGARDEAANPEKRLVIAAATDDESRLADAPAMRDAVITNAYIAPHSVRKVLDGAKDAAQFDLATNAFHVLLAGTPAQTRVEIGERLRALIGEKAHNPETIQAAGAALLDARREEARGVNFDYVLLSIARVFDYGRSLRRPLAIWACVVATIVAHRVYQALKDPRGDVVWHHGLHVSWDGGHLLFTFGDTVLSILLLPANWVRLQEASGAVGLTGGYLSGARLVLLIVVVLFLAAARRRLRVNTTGAE